MPDFAYAAFKHGVYLQLAPNLADVLVFSLKRKCRRPRRYPKRFDLRQRVDDLFCNAIAEKFVLRIIAHVDEGKDGDAFVWRR